MNPYAILGLILFGYMSLWYLISIIAKRNDVADVAWGLGFVLMAWASYFILGDAERDLRQLAVAICVTLWGLDWPGISMGATKVRAKIIAIWPGVKNGVSGFT